LVLSESVFFIENHPNWPSLKQSLYTFKVTSPASYQKIIIKPSPHCPWR